MASDEGRRFKVKGLALGAEPGVELKIGYLWRHSKGSIRVEVSDEARGRPGRNTVTVQEPDSRGRPGREYVTQVDRAFAKNLLRTVNSAHRLNVTRHRIEYRGHGWEVDVYHGRCENLLLARSLGQIRERPEWLGDEVTADPRYWDDSLCDSPRRS